MAENFIFLYTRPYFLFYFILVIEVLFQNVITLKKSFLNLTVNQIFTVFSDRILQLLLCTIVQSSTCTCVLLCTYSIIYSCVHLSRNNHSSAIVV